MALPPPTIDTTVLVTGASAGIGAELARELARRGHNVVLSPAAPTGWRLAEELRLTHGVHADVEPCDLDRRRRARAASSRGWKAGERAVVGVCNNAGFGTVATLRRGRRRARAARRARSTSRPCTT